MLASVDKGTHGFSRGKTTSGVVILVGGRQPACLVCLASRRLSSVKNSEGLAGWSGALSARQRTQTYWRMSRTITRQTAAQSGPQACVPLSTDAKETGNHILYRSTPIFEGNNLLASGVLLEAYSVEDNGDGICFNVYCYNVQPDISINYATGDSSFAGTQQTEPPKQTEQSNPPAQNVESTYILNVNTKKFHYPSCSSVKQMSDKNKQTYTGSRDDLISQGYDPCKKCNP